MANALTATTIDELHEESAEPEPGAGELLVAMRAASVNPVDFKIRSGGLKVLVKDRFPLVLGSDVSGVVVRVGPGVTRFAPGDDVFARLRKDRIGSFAEFVLVDEALAAKKPSNLTHAEAASIPLVGETSLQALVEIGRLQKGQRCAHPRRVGRRRNVRDPARAAISAPRSRRQRAPRIARSSSASAPPRSSTTGPSGSSKSLPRATSSSTRRAARRSSGA